MIDWSLFRWPKIGRLRRPSGRSLARCYAEVDARDGGVCRFPGCYRPSVAHHHLVFRSKSKAGMTDPCNVISICAEHHRWVHELRWVTVWGDAADAVTWAVTTLGHRAGRVLPFTVTTPASHVQPVRFLGHVERDPTRLPGEAAVGTQKRGAVVSEVPRA